MRNVRRIRQVLGVTIFMVTSRASTVSAWDEYENKRKKEAEDRRTPAGLGFAIRSAPVILQYPRTSFGDAPGETSPGSAGGVMIDAEVLNLTTASGFGGGFSIGGSFFPSYGEFHIPIKTYLAFAEKHGMRASAHGMIQPALSTFGDSDAAFFAGMGLQLAYDFELPHSTEAWLREKDAHTWGLGLFLDGSALTPVIDSGFVGTGEWIGTFSLGVIARYH